MRILRDLKVRLPTICCTSMPALAGTAEQPVETVGPGTMLGIGLFLVVAALIVVSVACKLLVFLGLVPKSKAGPLHRTILWLANVVGEVRLTEGRRDRGGGRSASAGGGGSSGGGGALGDY